MAIVLDATSSGRNSTGTITVSHTVGSLSNGVLYVLTSAQDSNHANMPVTGITFGGVALTKVRSDEAVGNNRTEIWGLINPTAGIANIVATVTGAVGEFALIGISLSGVDQTTPTDAQNGTSGNSSGPATIVTSVTDNAWFLAMCSAEATFSANGTGQTTIATLTDQSYENARGTYEGPKTSAGSDTQGFTLSSGQSWALSSVAVKPAVTGITFDVASNSGDQAAASSYSGSASWNGSNRVLCVDVSMLGAGVTVTAMTYGGAACTLVGVKSTVTSFGRVEQWRILQSDSGAPATGANTLAVTLSGSLEFAVEWVSYTGVHQTSPIEGFNSNQATNAGSATDASVAVTTVADNDWVHAAVVANDTAITAGNTSRNNIPGTLGSGGNEDNGAPKTPAGAVTMSYTGMGITTTWAIAAYALRDINAASIVTSTVIPTRMLQGMGL